MMLGACGIKENDYGAANMTQKISGGKININNAVNNVERKSGNIEKGLHASPGKSMEISNGELKQYLISKKSEILKAVGNQTETGTISITESHMVFPTIFENNLGLTFIFPNETDDISPTYIYINEETNAKNVNIKRG